MTTDNPKTLEEWSESLKDETLDELDAKIKARSEELEADRIIKLAELELKTPLIMKLEEKRLQNERLDQQLEEVEEFEAKQLKTITMADLQAREFPPESYIIDKILPISGFTMFVGESGSGKSFLALELVRAITTKTNFLEHFEVKQSVPILIIDKENGLRRTKKRAIGMGIPASNQIHLLEYPEKFTLDNVEFLQTVTDFITEKEVKVIILDSFIDFLITSENDPVEISRVFSAFRLISPDIVYVPLHHDSKPIPRQIRTAIQKTRGSSNIVAQLDNQFYLEKTKNPKIITIEQGKSRDMEPVKKFQVEFQSDPETGEMTGFKYLGEIQDVVKAIEEAQEFIYQYLHLQEYSYSTKEEIDIAGEAVGLTARTLKDALNQMSKKGITDYIKKPGEGNKHYYFLVEGGEKDESIN